MDTKITYTFPEDHKVAALAGRTLQGGVLYPVRGELNAVMFETRVNDQIVLASLTTNPGLADVVAEHEARKQVQAEGRREAASSGWCNRCHSHCWGDCYAN